jgi:hypothetical protein
MQLRFKVEHGNQINFNNGRESEGRFASTKGSRGDIQLCKTRIYSSIFPKFHIKTLKAIKGLAKQ